VNLEKVPLNAMKESEDGEQAESGEEEEDELLNSEDVQPGSLWRILRYSRPEWVAMLVGSLASIVVGCSCPVISILFGEIYGVSSLLIE